MSADDYRIRRAVGTTPDFRLDDLPSVRTDTDEVHRLLRRQLRRHLKAKSLDEVPEEMRPLLDAVNQAYLSTDADRDLMERSLELTSLELNEKNDDLARSNTELSQFAYVVSHDLQEPLRSVAGYTKLLVRSLETDLTDDQQELVDGILGGVERMREFILALLEYSRVGRREVELERLKLGDVLEAATLNLAMAIEDNKATVAAPQGLPTVSGDPVKLTQLFQNLIGNALKFRRPEAAPFIELSWWKTGDHAEITLRDNGLGIPEDQRENVFQLFQRLHRNEEIPGTGLGLAICQKVVWQHGGRIWIEPPGLSPGTTFRFTLPLWADETDGGRR